jgi:hypothetical protein
MTKVEVTKLRIITTRGANKTPSFGDVWFSDGKVYTFLRNHTGTGWDFFTDRKSYGSWECITFKPSAARVAALEAALG